MTTKLTDTQNVIISKAIARKNIVPSFELANVSCDLKAYKAAVNGLIRRGILEVTGGFVQTGDFDKDGVRYVVSASFLNEEVPPAKTFKVAKTTGKKASTAIVDEVEGDIEEMEEDLSDVAEDDSVEDTTDEEEGADDQGSIVKEAYRRKYQELKNTGGTGQDCNDIIAKFLNKFFTSSDAKGRPVLKLTELLHFADMNNIDMSRVMHLNNGQKRMRVGNGIRAMIRMGEDVIYNGAVVFEGAKVEKKTKKAK